LAGRLLGLAVLAAAVAGCGSSHSTAPVPVRTGPPGVIRIGIADLRWPLDPALAEGRDETQLARTLYSTPLRVDAAGALRPGLCGLPRTADSRIWDLTCRDPAAIAAELRRVASLPGAPSAWLFADAQRIEARGSDLRIVLRHPWRRFPYALTAVAAAPPSVPGPFRVVSASPRRIVAVRPGLRLVFNRMEPHAAAVAFGRGKLDEAPVALGDIRAVRLDPALAGMVRVQPLLGVDLVAFQMQGGSLARTPVARRVFWQTADRQSYQALVPEFSASAAYGLTAGASTQGGAPATRAARRLLGSLPPVAVHVAVPDDPDLVYGADLAVAQWRDLSLGAAVDPLPAGVFRGRLAAGTLDAWFGRVLAPYPEPEALLGQVLLPRDGRDPWLAAGSGPARTLRRALAAGGGPLLARADDELQRAAAVVPLGWASDARLVSPRLRGWRRDPLGVVDYAAVRAPAASRRP
jgi:hypothetical protein